MHTGVIGKVRVLLALVEAVLLLLLLDLGVGVGSLVTVLVDATGADVGLSRHDCRCDVIETGSRSRCFGGNCVGIES